MDKSRRKIKPIARKRRNILYLLLTILFAITTSYIFLSFPPEHKFQLLTIGIPIVPFFLISLFIFTYSVIRFIFINASQALLISSLSLVFIIFRLFGLTHWIFAVLFFALLITFEFFLRKQK